VKSGAHNENKRILKPTPFGPVAIIWSIINGIPKIIRVLLSRPGLSAEDNAFKLYPDSSSSSCLEIENIADSMKAHLEGEDITFSLDATQMPLCSSFQESVLQAEHGIPRGSVSTYKLLAEHLGRPNGARAVGNALANNPFPLIIPCHRAVRSDLHLGGYQGGLEMKQALLAMEGIYFDDLGRVIVSRFYYGR
jgi:methylated-DNA-[protein]-cysteine S-methyltransferase